MSRVACFSGAAKCELGGDKMVVLVDGDTKGARSHGSDQKVDEPSDRPGMETNKARTSGRP